MQWRYRHHPLEKLFAGLVEDAFCVEVGLCDPKLTDYVVALLLEFLHVDSLYTVRDGQGKRVRSLAKIVARLEQEAGVCDETARAELHRHIGDLTLFWTGVFPEELRGQRRGVSSDGFVAYVDRGKESYAIASALTDEDADPPGRVLKRLSSEFEMCAHGLGLVRQGWENRDFDPGGGDPHLLY